MNRGVLQSPETLGRETDANECGGLYDPTLNPKPKTISNLDTPKDAYGPKALDALKRNCGVWV